MAWLMFVLVLMLGRVFECSVLPEAAPHIAKPKCRAQCGGVDIPYPFGIGPGCFTGEWFEIICPENNTMPLLRWTNHTVTNISVEDGTVTVRNPITFFDCEKEHEAQQSPRLEGSPFRYSQPRNRFVSVACGWMGLMRNSSTSKIIGVCVSVCKSPNTFLSNNTCDGSQDCCQTTIPLNLQGFNTSFRPTELNSNPGECTYAFLVDRYWFSSNVSNVYALRNVSEVPVVLEWELYNSTGQVFGAFVKTLNRRKYEEFRYNRRKSTRRAYRKAENATESTARVRNSSCTESASLMNPNSSKLECSCPGGFDGNPYLLQECHGICSGLGSLLLLVGGWLLYRVIKKKQNIRRQRMIFKRNGGLLLQQEISSTKENSYVEKTKLFNSKELVKATDKFNADRILGRGGQGTVYKGMLADGKIVAVKKSKLEDQSQVAQFINEVVILSQINHRNVVKLLGCCLETEVPLLVYEFVPNGTLSQFIHSENEEFPLTWEVRVRIATEVAGALSYLHMSASTPIFHRDIKSTNILLDDKYRAKIADFGTSKSIPLEKTHLTTQVFGTFGYLDPEYFQSSHFTDKSDVYSFGVVLVQLLSGQKPVSVPTTSDNARGLAINFTQCMEEDRLFDIVDPRVVNEGEKEAIIAFANIAKQCLNLNGRNRPTMREVANFLEDIERTFKPCDAQADMEVAEYAKDEIELNSPSCSSLACSSTFGTDTFSPSKGTSLLSRESK